MKNYIIRSFGVHPSCCDPKPRTFRSPHQLNKAQRWLLQSKIPVLASSKFGVGMLSQPGSSIQGEASGFLRTALLGFAGQRCCGPINSEFLSPQTRRTYTLNPNRTDSIYSTSCCFYPSNILRLRTSRDSCSCLSPLFLCPARRRNA